MTNFIDVFDTTQLAIDLDLETHKVALYLDALAPNFSTDVGYSATNEASGTGYTAGGNVSDRNSVHGSRSRVGSVRRDRCDMARFDDCERDGRDHLRRRSRW